MKTYKQFMYLAVMIACMASTSSVNAQIITTIAGTGVSSTSGDGGAATLAQLNNPYQVAIDPTGNIYVADFAAHRVREIKKTGIIVTFAGNGVSASTGDGIPATDAPVKNPIGVAADHLGNVYISEYSNGVVRKVNAAGIISTFVSGLDRPTHLCTDPLNNLYIAIQSSNEVMKVTPAGTTSIYAGTGVGGFSGDGGAATDATLYLITGITSDKLGNIYVSSWIDGHIRKINAAGIITTIAGTDTTGFFGDGGPATAAKLNQPYGISADSAGNLYIADNANNRIRYISAATGVITTIAGTGVTGYNGDGIPATVAHISSSSVCSGTDGDYYFNDGSRIRRVTTHPDPPASIVSITDENSLKIYPNPGNGVFIMNLNTQQSEKVTVVITNMAGEKVETFFTISNIPTKISINQPTGIYFISACTTKNNYVTRVIVR